MSDDVAYHSAEIQLSNNTPSTLTVQSAHTAGVGVSWISGEQPSGSLSPFASVVWGVMTRDPSGDASATVALAGAGSELALARRSPGGTPAQASVTDHPSIVATIRQLDTAELGRASFQIVLMPRAAAANAPDAAGPGAVEPGDATGSAEPDPSDVAESAEPGA